MEEHIAVNLIESRRMNLRETRLEGVEDLAGLTDSDD